jgi:hypothetical protein
MLSLVSLHDTRLSKRWDGSERLSQSTRQIDQGLITRLWGLFVFRSGIHQKVI